MRGTVRIIAVVLTLNLSLTGCAATQSFRTCETFRREIRLPRILMMQPDVELSELKTGGSFAINDLWTRSSVFR